MPVIRPRSARDAAAIIEAATERVLAVEYPAVITPAIDGSGFAVTWRSPGHDATRLYTAGGTQVASIAGAAPICWHAGGFITVRDGALQRLTLDNREPQVLGAWAGRSVAATAGDDIWLAARDALFRHAPDGSLAHVMRFAAPLLDGVTLSPSGAVLAVRTVEAGGDSALRLHSRDGEETLRWHEPGWCVLGASFAGKGWVVVTRMRKDSSAREVTLLDIATGEREVLVSEASERGFVKLPPAVTSAHAAAYVRYVDGWPLLCVYHLGRGHEVVVNPGPHEDLTDVDDAPAFSPDGRYVAFNSSAADRRERHLYVYDTWASSLRRLSHEPGATAAKAWLSAERLIFAESHATRGASLRCAELGGSDVVTTSAPRPAARGVRPEPITLGVGAHRVPADLYLPRGVDAGDERPALVYAHGGVFRQLTRGYPASYAYTLLHEINLGLLELGFVVISVEYRGSTGFGLAHEQANHMACGVVDTEDCAEAARYLARLPFVDPKRIGIWGLSWGGTLTLQALVRHPELFAAGASLAGIWDFEQRATYWNALQAGLPIYFDGRMGPTCSEARRLASARMLAERLRAPLLSLHGTRDESVDYAQQELLGADAERLGKRVRTHAFEGEGHVFSSAEAWRKAAPAILNFLLKHLGTRSA